MRRKTKTWIPLCTGISLLATHQAFAQPNQMPGQNSMNMQTMQNQMMPNQMNMPMMQGQMQGNMETSRHQLLQNLLQEHGLLLNQAIVGALNNDPQQKIEATKQQLLNNAHQIAMLISSRFGPQAGSQFEPLMDQHITLGSDYINAVKLANSEQANQVANQALQNGRMIAQFLSNLFPSVPSQIWQHLLEEHVMLEAQQTQAYFMRNMNQAEQLKNKSLAQLREIANTVLSAIKGQNNNQNPSN